MTNTPTIVARILIAGGMLSVALMLSGLVAFAVRGGVNGETLNLDRLLENRAHGRSANTFTSVGDIRRALEHRPVDPVAVIASGVVLLLFTPVAGIAGALVAFIRAKDWRYATIASLLLAALVVSFFFGGAG
jgi:uncharacterized membrane protein